VRFWIALRVRFALVASPLPQAGTAKQSID
jgi:hypothetical protein